MAVIGRATELAELDRRLTGAAAGTGGLAVLVGPSGAGTTAVALEVASRARAAGRNVLWASVVSPQPPLAAWGQLVRDASGDDALVEALLHEPTAAQLAEAVALLVGGRGTLLVLDGVDEQGEAGLELVSMLTARLPTSATLVLVTARRPLGAGTVLRMGPLEQQDFDRLFPDLAPPVRRALWIASEGLPGVAVRLALELGDRHLDDPVAHIALRSPSRARFLDVDVALVALLEEASASTRDDAVQARLLARLARELLGDASAAARRRRLVDDALVLARSSGDSAAVADVLDARLHALWDPAGADARLAAASDIVELARAAADRELERRGAFWRFVALVELGRMGDAESALAGFRHAAAAAGDEGALVMVAARDAMFAAMRGRFDLALAITDEVAAAGARVGLPDAEALVGTLRGAVTVRRPIPADVARGVDQLMTAARYQPGHFFEASAARLLVLSARLDDAAAELRRMLPAVQRGSGPRWIGAVADLAIVAVATADRTRAGVLHELLLPYAGRWVVWGGANTAVGPVDLYLGLLASALDDHDGAGQHLRAALALAERNGALPSVADAQAALAALHTLRGEPVEAERWRRQADALAAQLQMVTYLPVRSARSEGWCLVQDGEGWLLEAGAERAHLRNGRGLDYLRQLVASPGQDIPALDLVAGGAGLVVAHEPSLDDAALRTYRRRLAALDEQLDAADLAGDPNLAATVEREREALVQELRRATGLGGRVRRTSAEAERARVNVTRTLRAMIDRIAAVAPRAGAHLDASIRTGRTCRYDPAAGGPARWKT